MSIAFLSALRYNGLNDNFTYENGGNKMELTQKIAKLNTLSSDRVLRTELFYDVLEQCGDLKFNYHEYASTHPIDCRQELLRLPGADYDTCCALLTMLLREDHFSNGSFVERQRAGQVKPIVDQMIFLLQKGLEDTI